MKTFRQKGLGFEIEIAKMLSKWAKESLQVEEKNLFWRTHGSGSAYGKLQSQFMAGDVVAVHPSVESFSNRVYIEAKRWKDIDLFGLYDGRNSSFSEVVGKSVKQAKKQNKICWFIFKRNRAKSPMLFTDKHILSLVEKLPHLTLVYEDALLVGVSLNVFLEHVSYKQYLTLLEGL